MYYVYILKSLKDEMLYIGKSSDLKRRFEEHNKGLNISTKNRRPFQLIYYEAFKSSKDANKRELNLKKFKNSYTELKKRIQDSCA